MKTSRAGSGLPPRNRISHRCRNTASRHAPSPARHAPPPCILNISNVKWYLCPTDTCISQGLCRRTQATPRLLGPGCDPAAAPAGAGAEEGAARGSRRRGSGGAGALSPKPGSLGDCRGRHRLCRTTEPLARLYLPNPPPLQFLSCKLPTSRCGAFWEM